MNRFERRMCKLLKPFQKKEILIRVIRESNLHSDSEKMELLDKLNKMDSEQINVTFEKVVNDLKRGADNV